MDSNTPAATKAAQSPSSGLVKARRDIKAARERGVAASDGGSTGRTDGND
ncbi:hypothetical protein [Streptomyces noursei]|nr:hypothetical protein [Streptomyces noursei]MCZ1019443.1 hypothetical protein [Streptomyces noursei]GGX08437.1 hypothetical protein GCM10010341_32700 [Streptomyces noursei]